MRLAIFVVYVWFGLLKVLGMTPADELVDALLTRTFPFVPEASFLIFLGIVEIFIGTLFFFPKFTRMAVLLLVIHMITTLLPLMLLPELTWAGFLQPTLVGQYILKNIVILALAMSVGMTCKPIGESK